MLTKRAVSHRFPLLCQLNVETNMLHSQHLSAARTATIEQLSLLIQGAKYTQVDECCTRRVDV